MTSYPDRFARAARRCTALGAAAVIAGVALAPAANADDATTGTLADTLLQTLASASAAGAGEAAQDESQQAQGPRVTLSQSVISATGEHEITVNGTGFTDAGVVGTRPPLAGRNPGVYVVLGVFADEWKPSEGAPSSARQVMTQHWAVNAEDVETIGGADRGAIVLGADGTFTVTFTVSKALVEDRAGESAGTLGIYTYAGSGAKHAAWETSQPISVAEPATGPFGSLAGLFPLA
ncbi:hypothetical protein NCCP2495_25380 [Dietzia sp. NCCP-2495]|uniref:hypothetical protein n=1 Tax=Dietzia sp. NCCP-2495 TaxID=2934675 RepID=UPI00223247B8|nr:hypothetical protein [Dietzia sp. NCCP-2495]GLB64659.1 hypothetical protein NCCP2495_25380 [Dietzia sp. NCCP-2495]